jgi:hypothetical protein
MPGPTLAEYAITGSWARAWDDAVRSAATTIAVRSLIGFTGQIISWNYFVRILLSLAFHSKSACNCTKIGG